MGGVYSSPEALAAFVATGLVSLAPNVLLLMMPHYAANGGGDTSRLLALGQSLGAGGLMADVFLHTLVDSATNESTGLYILLGFVVFFAVDLLLRSVNEQHHDHNAAKSGTPAAKKAKRSLVLLNLVADSLHNFTDGLAIGASYILIDSSSSVPATFASVWALLQSHTRGGFATLSILFHEVPHELSDFCTLVRAGYSTRQAIYAQMFTALAAFAGTAVAIAVSTTEWAQEKLLLLTAGGFLYLAGTTILPEVLAEAGPVDCVSRRSRLLFRFAQLVAFCVGILFLSLVDLINGEHHHDHHHGEGTDRTHVLSQHDHSEL